MWVISLAFSFALIVAIRDVTAKEISDVNAVVTLVTGASSPYASGAIALGQSLIDVGSKLKRVVMVTPEVEKKTRDSMSRYWEVIEVQPIACNHQNRLDPKKFDLAGDNYQAGIQRWSATCTKFAAFKLTQFERIIFMDSDMLVVGPIDDAIYGFSNASFLASPETFPPDTFNSGFLVLNPSKANYENIMEHNAVTGSAEGGDQG
jgi:glycogenin